MFYFTVSNVFGKSEMYEVIVAQAHSRDRETPFEALGMHACQNNHMEKSNVYHSLGFFLDWCRVIYAFTITTVDS